jgi:hypothetical protein
MLTQKLALRSNSLATSWFRVPLKFSGVRSLHRCTLPCKIACRPGFKAQDAAAAFAFDWSKIRHYSDAAQARIQEEGLPLQVSMFWSSDGGVLAMAASRAFLTRLSTTDSLELDNIEAFRPRES